MAPVNCTVPVTPLPPVVLVGVTETDDRVGPGGGAGLTERLAVRRALVFSTHAVICTMIGAAAGFEEMVNVVPVWPAGTTTLCGTSAASGWSLTSSTVVGAASGPASETVPVADAPLFTWLGTTVRKLIMPAAFEAAGATSSAATTPSATTTARTLGTVRVRMPIFTQLGNRG